MMIESSAAAAAAADPSYSRIDEITAFDETKAGVKGLVDGGITKVPRMFIHPPETLGFTTIPDGVQFSLPIVNLEGMGKDPIRHKQIVENIKDASESWGFFQVVNHGIPVGILEDMIKATRDFHEQDSEIKKQFYTRDHLKGLNYFSNFHLYTLPIAEWGDMFSCSMAPVAPEQEDLPGVCRETMTEYSKRVMELSRSLFGLLSEGLGLGQNHLVDMGCADGLILIGHYYPACPEPDLTLGLRRHTDDNLMTILLQDNVGGLQVVHQDQWVDVAPIPGALVVNIGNIMQILSNDRFKSAEHRVLAKSVGPRTSVASFLTTGRSPSSKLYGPISELLSEAYPPKYRAVTIIEYDQCFRANGSDGLSTLQHFRL